MKSSNRGDGWLTGRLYFNREDKRVIIKRSRSGFSYTMNLGNKWTWIITKTKTHFSHIIILKSVFDTLLRTFGSSPIYVPLAKYFPIK